MCLVAMAIILSPARSFANTCVASKKPPKVSGALCGRAFDRAGGTFDNAELKVLDDNDYVMSTIRTDSTGNFVFPQLPVGQYRLAAPGWHIEFGRFEISRSSAVCKRRRTVVIGITGCDGGLDNAKPRR